ncbi:MAG: hypothetical protein HY821_06400 [Acidobacteria bacterium]|nr:hypothetical protein [Acidobacteriota bacterium]
MEDKKAEIFERRAVPLMAAVVLLGAATARPAYGYTDPGSGLLLWQMVGAAAVGSLFYVKRLLRWLSPKKKTEKDEGQREE